MNNNYGEAIKTLRKKAGMTQKELAEKAGCSINGIRQWEKNKRIPQIEMLYQLSEGLNCDISSLIYTEIKENQNVDNPYWERICELANYQRNKGIGKYGKGLEDNPAAMIARIRHLQEELIDGLMYCEWIKDKLMELEGEKHD